MEFHEKMMIIIFCQISMVIFLVSIHDLMLIKMEQSSNLISSGPIKGWQIAIGEHQEPEKQGTVLEVEADLVLC